MFNFYVVVLVVTQQGYHAHAKNSKPHRYKKSTKIEKPSEHMGFNGKTVWRFQTKKRTETLFSTFQKPHWDTRSLKPSIEYCPFKQ